MIISWLLLLYFWGIIALQCKVEYTAEGFILKLFTLETPYMCSKTQNADFVFELSSQLLASCIRLADLTHGKSTIHKIGISLRHINLQWSCCCEHVAVICLCCCDVSVLPWDCCCYCLGGGGTLTLSYITIYKAHDVNWMKILVWNIYLYIHYYNDSIS